MDTKTLKPRKAFTVIIHSTEYDVWDIEGREHEGRNGENKTYWLYYAERLPEGTTPPADSENFVPFDSGINRWLWDIKITQRNTSKEKYDETYFSNTTNVEMFCNRKKVYAFATTGSPSGLAFAMAKVQYLQVILAEHSFNFFDPFSENGRKIFYYGLPAIVRVREKENPWEISIEPDYTDGLSREEWWRAYKSRKRNITLQDDDEAREDQEIEDMYDEEDVRAGYINWGDALSDQHINWHRR